VAIKVLLALSDPAARKRLWREARAAASLNHPNVCQLYEISEENGVLFLAMELLDGESLAVRLARGPLFAPKRSRLRWRSWPRSKRCIAGTSCIAI
jgi:serine/threonine protein kinase